MRRESAVNHSSSPRNLLTGSVSTCGENWSTKTLTATAIQRSIPLLQVAFMMQVRLTRLYPSLHCVQLVPGPWQLKQFSSHLKMDRKTSHESPLFMSKKINKNDRFPENTREARRPEQKHHHMNMYEGVRPTSSDASMPVSDSRKKSECLEL